MPGHGFFFVTVVSDNAVECHGLAARLEVESPDSVVDVLRGFLDNRALLITLDGAAKAVRQAGFRMPS